MLGAFSNWPTFTAQLYVKTVTKDAQGQVIESYVLTGSPVMVFKYISRSSTTNPDDRFVNDELGKIVFTPNGQAVNIDDYFLIGGDKYYIIGMEPDIMGFGDVAVLDYRREYGFRR